MHWGIQDLHNHTSEIHNLAHNITKESDVDFILGSHSHCIQGIKSDKGKELVMVKENFIFIHRSRTKEFYIQKKSQ